MIKYCCWYCKKHGDCTGCYNAAGGEEYFRWAVAHVCKIKIVSLTEDVCVEDFPFNKVPISECWEPLNS